LAKTCIRCNKKILFSSIKYEEKYYHKKCADEQRREDIINKEPIKKDDNITSLREEISEKSAWNLIDKYVDEYDDKWECMENLITILNKKYDIHSTKLTLLDILNDLYENKRLINININRLEKDIKSKDKWDIIRNYVEKYDNPTDEFTKLIELLTLKYKIDVSKKDLSHLLFKLFNDKEKIIELRNYDELKNKILSHHPKTKEDYTDTYLKYYDEYDRSILPLFEKLLFENDFKVDNLKSLIKDRKKFMNINGFEDELYKKKSQEYIDVEEMSSSEFENFIKDLFVLMEYSVDNKKSDEIEGADLIIEKSGEKTAVQAKSFLDFVKDSDVKDVIKAKEYHSCDKAMIVASSFFTKNALDIADKNDVKTWDGKKLKELIEKYRISTSDEKKNKIDNENIFRL
jgi:hypothetical protein